METSIASVRSVSRLPLRQLWLLPLLVQFISLAHAETELKFDSLQMTQAQSTIERLEREVSKAQTATAQDLKALRREIGIVRTSAQNCVQETEPQVALLDDEIAVLQPKTPGDAQTETEGAQSTVQPAVPASPAITSQLKELQSKKADLQGRIAACKLMLLSSNDLESRVDDYLRGLQARQLLTRDASLPAVLRANLDERQRWLDLVSQWAGTRTDQNPIDAAVLIGAATSGALGCILGFIIFRVGGRRLLARLVPVTVEEERVAKGLVDAFMASAARYGPLLLALGGIIAYLELVPSAIGNATFMISIIYGLLIYFVFAAVIRALLNPYPPATHYLPLPVDVAIALSRRSRILVLIVLIRWPLLELHTGGVLDESMYNLVRHIVGWVFVLNFIWISLLLRRLEGWRDRSGILLLISLALVAGLIAAGIGYMNLGALIILGIAYSLALLGLILVVNQFFSDVFDGLDEGRYGWQKAVRRAMGLKAQEYVPGLGWLRLVLKLGLWIGAILVLLSIWDSEEQVTGDLLRFMTEGFQVGSLTIVPTHLLWAILVFAISLPLTGWLKGRLNTKWLVETRMEPSAREALVTTFGYVAVAVAALVSLSLAGINFSNLAIIAGALSVGVGFGLQNIVNNFVSGIIMLVERPVRSGDWIVVGNTEGTVQRISIRSTTIRTFDRADVIVPNSDLISGQVTNWTLGNTWGRVKVQVGVAYASDIDTVIEILLEVANSHGEVVKDHYVLPDPHVLFLEFGDSSLNFELRAIVRDVNRRLHVISDLNRAINAAFKQRGIEIPFPQRDVNFRGPLHVDPDDSVPPRAAGGEEAP